MIRTCSWKRVGIPSLIELLSSQKNTQFTFPFLPFEPLIWNVKSLGYPLLWSVFYLKKQLRKVSIELVWMFFSWSSKGQTLRFFSATPAYKANCCFSVKDFTHLIYSGSSTFRKEQVHLVTHQSRQKAHLLVFKLTPRSKRPQISRRTTLLDSQIRHPNEPNGYFE